MTRDREPEGVVRIRARNPSPLTLDGTNTYIATRWVVDPGPDDSAHLDAIVAAAPQGIEGIVLTHDHADHAAGAPALSERTGARVVRPRGDGDAGPFRALATPGHSRDHVCLVLGRICFTGDAVLGTGSVFIPPGEGSLAAYLASLERLRALDLDVLCPGHGPFVWDPRGKVDEYIAHRLERERKLLVALDRGLRRRGELLDAAWDDAPPELRAAASLTLDAHLEKLRAEGRLPADLDGAIDS
jgi:glyoxylase-like metal-dependent hydrolase (beta-lactamase superfamily II)